MISQCIMTDTKMDGAFPVQCELRLDGSYIVIQLPTELDFELFIPVEDIGTVINDELHG